MIRLSLVFFYIALCIGNVNVTQAQVKQSFKLSAEILYGISEHIIQIIQI